MILDFHTCNDKALIIANYEAAKEFYSIVLDKFDTTREKDILWFQWAQSWRDESITQMIRCTS